MVCDDHGHPLIFCHLNLRSSGNSIITGHNGVNSVFPGSVYQMLMNPITICYSVRNISIHICPDPCQALQQNVCRGHPVDIIISDNPYLCLLLYFSLQNIHCFFHIFHQPRGGDLLYRSKQILPYFFFSDHISVSNQSRDHRINMKLLSDLVKVCFLCSHYPFLHLCSPCIINC